MNNLPIFIKLQRQNCLVVGGGVVAARKINQLLVAEAKVFVVAPELHDEIKEFSKSGEINHINQDYTEECMEGKQLVIAATNNGKLNAKIAEHAKSKNILVNVVDNPDAGTFILPSIIDRSPVVIAVSTSGVAPVLTKLLSSRIETLIPFSYGKLSSLISQYRSAVKEKIPDRKSRRRFWENILDGPIAEMFYAGQEEKTLKLLERQLANETPHIESRGEVYLVGGGPGDPELLTFRALRLMQQADVVLYDRLVAPKILEFVRKDAEKIYVGKERDRHALPQAEINKLLFTVIF